MSTGVIKLCPLVGLTSATLGGRLLTTLILTTAETVLTPASVVSFVLGDKAGILPKFVGSRVHLNPLAVTIALMLRGMLWGGIGLILAIPITAGIKAICDNVGSLKPYGRLLGD